MSPQLTEFQRGMIVGAYEMRNNAHLVSRTLGIPQATSTVLPAHFVFQHDNVPAHRSWMTSQLLEDLDIRLLSWPLCSSDLNLIEHVWDVLGRRMPHREYRNLSELFSALNEEWDNFPQEDLDNLISSMPRRVGAVISAKGDHTRY